MTTKTNAQRLIDLFGGKAKMAKATGLDPATITRFTGTGARGCHGEIPIRNFDTILDAAKKKGFPKQAALYLRGQCPTCGQKVAADEKKSS